MYSRNIKARGCLLLTSALTLSLAGCGPQPTSPTATAAAEPDNGAPQQVVANAPVDDSAGSFWTVGSEQDDLTDATITRAVANVESEQNRFEVSVECSSTGSLAYKIAAYDGDGRPTEFRKRYSDGAVIDISVRLDRGPAASVRDRSNQYSNVAQISMAPNNFWYGGPDETYDWVAAKTVTLRFQMTSSEDTIRIQQADAEFQNAVAPCIAARREFLAKARKVPLNDSTPVDDTTAANETTALPPLEAGNQSPAPN